MTRRNLRVQAGHRPQSTDVPRNISQIEPAQRNLAGNSNISSELRYPPHNRARDVPRTRSQEARRDSNTCFTQHFTFIHEKPHNPTVGTVPQGNEPSVDSVPSDERENTDYPTQSPNPEELGPRCFMSFCSRSSIDWVASKVKAPGFPGVARNIAIGLARVLKVSGSLPASKAPEPDQATAWRYTRGKF